MKKIILSILLLPMALFGQETILISAVMDGDVSGGNPKMIDDSFMMLTEMGFATSSIKREKYISSNK